jgi:protease-4
MLVRTPASAAGAGAARRSRAAALAPGRRVSFVARAAPETTTTTTTTAAAAAEKKEDDDKPPSKDSWFDALLRFGGDNNDDDDDDDDGDGDGGREPKAPKWASFDVARDVPPGALDGLAAFSRPEASDLAGARSRLRSLALPWRRVAEGSFLAFKLEGDIPDALQGAPTPWPSAGPPSVPQVCEALEKAAYDPRVAGLAVEIGPLAIGWARLREIARRVELFRASGKPCVAFVKLGGEKEYLLATSFAEVFAPPSASLRLNGFAVSGTFLRGALDKVGIDPQVRRIGAYKSAGDQLDRRDMSDAQREALSALVDAVYGEFAEQVARGRNAARDARAGATLYEPYERALRRREEMKKKKEQQDVQDHDAAAAAAAAAAPPVDGGDKTPDDVRALLDEGVFEAERLLAGGWIDGLLYEDELIDVLKRRSAAAVEAQSGASAAAAARRRAKKAAKAGLDALPRVGLRKYSRVGRGALSFALAPNRGGSKKKPRVSILRAGGAITQGSGSSGGSGITPGALIPKLRALARDPATAAVVLRVDSPGGDALASDLMWREVRKLAQRKPVVACMGDVAASGGYYIAMAATAVVASRLTITGSIGVVTAKPSLGGVYERTGVTKEIVSRGRYAQLLAADNRPFTEDERALFDRGAERAYAEFRDKAAESRGVTPDEMERWAQGRVWAGDAALERGLVDAIGGVDEAVRIAEVAAGLYGEDAAGEEGGRRKGKRTPVVEVSVERPSPLALLTGGGGGGASAGAAAAVALASLAAAALGGAAGGGAAGLLGLMLLGGGAAGASSSAAAAAGAVGSALAGPLGAAAAAATGAPMALLSSGAEVSAVGSDLAMAQARAGASGGAAGLAGLLLGGGAGAASAGDCDFLDERGSLGGGASRGVGGVGVAAALGEFALAVDEWLMI